MAALPTFPNLYTHRKVADTAAKSCEICYKSSTSVLITPEKQDFFYVCPSHLKQAVFCTPYVDQAAKDAKKAKELQEEVERVKKEYEEKQRKKKEKETKETDDKSSKEKEKEKEQGDDKKKKEEDEKDEKSKSPATEKTAESPVEEEEEPRVFTLHRTFYQNRLFRKRQAEMDKRSRERIENPNFFPSVPKGLP